MTQIVPDVSYVGQQIVQIHLVLASILYISAQASALTHTINNTFTMARPTYDFLSKCKEALGLYYIVRCCFGFPVSTQQLLIEYISRGVFS